MTITFFLCGQLCCKCTYGPTHLSPIIDSDAESGFVAKKMSEHQDENLTWS